MEPFRPRTRNEDGDLLCEGCSNGREGRPLTGAKTEQYFWAGAVCDPPFIRVSGKIVKTAHDSGDGETIYHCPFCGSGQVVARSDGTTECEFCSNCFIVQIQPQQHSMPQTINGVPYQIPGMPERATGQPPGGGTEGDATQQQPGAGGDDQDENKSFGGDDLSDKVQTGEVGSLQDLNKGAFLTREGVALPLDSFVAKLALEHSDDRDATLEEVRRSNRGD